MSTRETGGPAFPTTANNIAYNGMGMTLRDYFAAKAMQALLTKCGPYGEDLPEPYSEAALNVDSVAAYSYLQADAMLKAREA